MFWAREARNQQNTTQKPHYLIEPDKKHTLLMCVFLFDRTLPGIFGSGSKYMIVSNSEIVFDNKRARHKMMHVFCFQERQGLANIPGEPLP